MKKTIMDAVNEFKGVWTGDSESTTIYALSETLHYGDTVTAHTICTRDEFKQCTAELSNWQPTLPKVEIQYDKYGNGYEIGGLYLVSDDGTRWVPGSFEGINKNADRYPYVADGCGWAFIKTCDDVGKIHKRPIELVDAAPYQFSANGGAWLGFYSKDNDAFVDAVGGKIVVAHRRECEDIILLAPSK